MPSKPGNLTHMTELKSGQSLVGSVFAYYKWGYVQTPGQKYARFLKSP